LVNLILYTLFYLNLSVYLYTKKNNYAMMMMMMMMMIITLRIRHVPVGIKNVQPASSVIRWQVLTISPKNTSFCRLDRVHVMYSDKLSSVGGISQNT